MTLSPADREAVVAVFKGDLPRRAARIADGIAAAEAAPPGAASAALGRIADELHNLRGAAAMLGFDDLAIRTADIEGEIGEARGHGDVRVTVDACRQLLAQLETMMAGAAEAEPREPLAAGEAFVEAGPIVLHVEDNVSNRKLVERVLARRPGVQLVEAESATQGIELAGRLQPALVLLDLRLPDESGERVLERLRADPATRDLRVVVVSAEARPAEASRLMSLGADDYIVKPIEIEALLELVDDALADRDE